MKIALFVGDMRVGGVTTFVLELGQILLKAGHTVTLVACGQGEWWPRLAEKGIPAVSLAPNRWESAVHHVRRLANHFIAERYDLVLINIGLGVLPVMRGLHGWPAETAAIPVLHNDLARVYAHAQINRQAWNVAVAVSPRVQSAATERLSGKTILTIPYGIRIPPEQQLTIQLPWETPVRLLFVGALCDTHKGILRLPKILAACRQRQIPARLTIIGEGGDRGRLEQVLAQCGLTDLVELRGAQPAEAVYQAMQAHHMLLMPSNFEGLPLVSLEAQANGCVPVASRLAGITDFGIDEGVSGYLVDREDIQGYVGAINNLLKAERWQSFSRAGIERIRQHFSVAVMGARYLDLIEHIAAGAYSYSLPEPQPSKAERLFTVRDYLPGALRSRFSRLAGWARGFL
ncbi:glycosyltransferase family 4 protein [Candidatus Chloroploca asiatica]|uniref:Uncharacterized protein n=1 Tax=Candidatus Chloroploca asiatica TaxID=1506545 RepID=A0A2H3L9V5_9CHLR|nr:glycosyltransferase family 4 protein [Candidatus Chloroploca asiatica]PDW00163.1 hypothetical protein A9Q02_21975 [Candidatus Chloroploca asiatica]